MTTDERIAAIEQHLHTLPAAQAEDASSTASTVADTVRSGLQGAYAEVRDALHESRAKISA